MKKGKQKSKKESSDLQEEQQKHKANLERRIYSLSDLEDDLFNHKSIVYPTKSLIIPTY